MHESRSLILVRAARALTYLVYAFTLIALVILTLGFFLLLFGANPEAGFAEWVYRSLDRVMAPFRGIFESIDLSGNSVLDTSVLFAMIVYGIAGLFLSAAVDWLSERVYLLRSRQTIITAPPREEQARRPTAV
jgi:uncharacterized protein YggT (Ycf19 family)